MLLNVWCVRTPVVVSLSSAYLLNPITAKSSESLDFIMGYTHGNDESKKSRMSFEDAGEPLRLMNAKSVNDLLKAVYDALEGGSHSFS